METDMFYNSPEYVAWWGEYYYHQELQEEYEWELFCEWKQRMWEDYGYGV